MSNQLKRNRRFTLTVSVGWLFADLLLALAMLFLVANTVGKPPPVPTPTPIPTATPTPTPTPTPAPKALDPQPFTFIINVDPTQLNAPATVSSVKDQVMQKLNQSHNGNHKVGFVLTFAGGAVGVDHAKSFNTILQSMPPFQGAVFKSYHDLGSPNSEFDLEIYFIQ